MMTQETSMVSAMHISAKSTIGLEREPGRSVIVSHSTLAVIRGSGGICQS
jgi:hypothetical protein